MRTKAQPTKRLIELIKLACKQSGNASRLALSINETKHNISSWIAGSRPCPLEAQILMAKVADLDVNGTIRQALIERNEGSKKGPLLLSALGKSLTQNDNV